MFAAAPTSGPPTTPEPVREGVGQEGPVLVRLVVPRVVAGDWDEDAGGGRSERCEIHGL